MKAKTTMSQDSTFITNEGENNLQSRFADLIKQTQFFDVLVGYFYTSGFNALYPALEDTDRIRILIGISTNRQTYDLLQKIQSHKQVGEEFSKAVQNEMEESENTLGVETGVKKFLEWLKNGKLEIRAYPEEKIHSKLYVMRFNDDYFDRGRVITGSSNFTQSGLSQNLEFNVELKDRSDYEFAQEQFNILWEKGVDVSEKYVETIQTNTWLREDITPYELYLKFLYEYFKQEINEDDRLDHHYRPDGFKELKYQDHAVINARKIVEEYGGVFLSDVVGLGKTFMGTMLCQELTGRTLVLAPPHLIDPNNQGSWENAFQGFGFRAKDYRCQSIGKLDKIIQNNEHTNFDIIVLDEAHRFRTEETETYIKLAQICRGKKVILVTATPYNNSPKDLLSQIKLFQRTKRSTIPNLPDIDGFFKQLEKNLKGLDRQQDREEYIAITRENARLIRERVLKHLMVRRTRREIVEYYGDDLRKQKMQFPEVAEPQPIFYEFSEHENDVFFKTLQLVTKELSYARYTPMLYHSSDNGQQGQKNMATFMRMLLIKRLESSFHAFRKTLSRFIESYQHFLDQFDKGTVYVSAKHTQKIFDLLERGDLDAVNRLVESEKAECFASNEFSDRLRVDLAKDLETLKQVHTLWQSIDRDPKVLAFKEKLVREQPIQVGKSIIFTESQETAVYLAEQLEEYFPGEIIGFSGSKSEADRAEVISNFDANAKNPKNDYRFLVTTDVLAEGANLHQANVVINYDIPWNPTRVMQRVGRINRVDTKHKYIFTYTFFPTDQSNDQIKLRELAEAKVAAFISLLGSDARLLTDDEDIEAHSLFDQLLSKEIIEGEDGGLKSELFYLQIIRGIRDDNPKMFERIKRLPKKARTARKTNDPEASLLTYFRKGKLQKFFKTSAGLDILSEELDFISAAELLEAKPTESRHKHGKDFYSLLEQNQLTLEKITEQEEEDFSSKRGSRDNAARLVKIIGAKQIRRYQGFTEDDEDYLSLVIDELNAGGIPKKLSSKIYKKIESTPELVVNPLKLLSVLKMAISPDFFQKMYAESAAGVSTNREVILSEYFSK